ncbi:hypothetical protein OGAPHI_000660 [Ogataea philodendri]|uniref:HTH APSES-type domain-containing protein n=1 Tax=Ogataea philodendri TaxID=1378263 RepID=A0A9P8PGP0_9ASCO|nr:uncharacterized protein OGAPHI_000660 [Ogataea philodendri]KAH3670949.1 hypothetical protein OGAPHI_000660 [Ogataea philodendri]
MSQQYSQYQQPYQAYQSYQAYQQGVMPSGPVSQNYSYQPYQAATSAPSSDTSTVPSVPSVPSTQPATVIPQTNDPQTYQYYPTAQSHYSQYSYPPQQAPSQSQQAQQMGYYYPQPPPGTYYQRYGQYPNYAQSYKGQMQYLYSTQGGTASSENAIQSGRLRPKITTTMWEDEKTLCYQVEANGVAVVRRADNDMVNGTKLLNVAKMTRGRRDGILKAEKTRHVVKIGSMHLKGVWIPFERALSMAQREGIVDLLYPLFVKDIKRVIQQGTPTTQATKSTEVPPYSYYAPQQYAGQDASDDKKQRQESISSKPKIKFSYGYGTQPPAAPQYSSSYTNDAPPMQRSQPPE